MDNYNQLVSRISEAAKISVDEIERRIEAKKAKLSGMVSKEGAAQIVAAELGINFDKERLKIAELVYGMRRVNVIGKILNIYPVREFNKNGRQGKVCSFLLADESSNARVVLWDVNHISLIEKGKLREGDVIEVSSAGVRNGEIHLSSFSDIKKSKEKLEAVVEKKVYTARKLNGVKVGDSLKTRAYIVQVFEPRYFEICPECGKKAIDGKCGSHGEVKVQKRAVLSLVLDDGSESIRAVLFGEQINKLGLSDEEIYSREKFIESKEKFLGEEKFFSGNARNNALYESVELNVEDVEEIDANALVNELERKV